MKSVNFALIGALALAGAAFAQVPSTNDTSDGSAANTGMGTSALGGPTPVNLTGTNNTASGYFALQSNTTGSHNSAFGGSALFYNTTGNFNTASGGHALFSNAGGNNNTASGTSALQSNTNGNDNTASGGFALYSNTTGNYNSASGAYALEKNTTGVQNTASGAQALFSNKTGSANTASGVDALDHNTSGSYNIAEGYKAGLNLTTGNYNIDIGNLGVAAESGVIRIGTSAQQTQAFMAGIYNTSVTGSAVMVSSTGQLGVTVSSERFKTAIAPMSANTAKLGQLRPVTFHLKTDPKGALQYGLIAEEVAKVYPELVIRDQAGRIDGVRYDELAPMLLNEVQRQAAEIRQLEQQQKVVGEMQQQMAEMRAALVKLQSNNELVATR